MNYCKDTSICSFDVFDTVLTRAVIDPRDIFHMMAKKLLSAKLPLPDKLVTGFYAARIWAEFSARKNSAREDITINDIYSEISKNYGLDRKTADSIMEIEMDTELYFITPVARTLKEIRQARMAGKKVVFVSDMYLPGTLIKEMLLNVGAYEDNDKIYISGELGLTKSSGNLFRHILEENNCSPREMCHFGDNMYSDLCVPHKMGIGIYGASQKELERIVRNTGWLLVKYRVLKPIGILFSGSRVKERGGH